MGSSGSNPPIVPCKLEGDWNAPPWCTGEEEPYSRTVSTDKKRGQQSTECGLHAPLSWRRTPSMARCCTPFRHKLDGRWMAMGRKPRTASKSRGLRDGDEGSKEIGWVERSSNNSHKEFDQRRGERTRSSEVKTIAARHVNGVYTLACSKGSSASDCKRRKEQASMIGYAHLFPDRPNSWSLE